MAPRRGPRRVLAEAAGQESSPRTNFQPQFLLEGFAALESFEKLFTTLTTIALTLTSPLQPIPGGRSGLQLQKWSNCGEQSADPPYGSAGLQRLCDQCGSNASRTILTGLPLTRASFVMASLNSRGGRRVIPARSFKRRRGMCQFGDYKGPLSGLVPVRGSDAQIGANVTAASKSTCAAFVG
jgi:hypothetical protein